MKRFGTAKAQRLEQPSWPRPQTSITIDDKVTGAVCVLTLDQPTWLFTESGKPRSLKFEIGPEGIAQRTVLMHAAGHLSGASIYQLGRNMIEHWVTHNGLLRVGPVMVLRRWDVDILSSIMGRTAKAILAAACRFSVGEWQPKHLDVVNGLHTTFDGSRRLRRSNVIRRSNLIDLQLQGRIVAVLDECAMDPSLPEHTAEAMVTMAFALQHAVRPVQVLALRRDHVRVYIEDAGTSVAVISFHAAKRSGGEEVELLRVMRPEWAPLIEQLLSHAAAAGRDRLCANSDGARLWNLVKQEFAARGVSISFTQRSLRHTGAQSLADSGHSRLSIQNFLGHRDKSSSDSYIKASAMQAHVLNEALGASVIYRKIADLAERRFATVEEMEAAHEDKQIGAIVGTTGVSGIGLCASGQQSCSYNPVTSCYGCSKFIPSLDRNMHVNAVEGMREQVLLFAHQSSPNSPAFRQLSKALALAQMTIASIDAIGAGEA